MNQKKRWGRLIAGAASVGLIGVGAMTVGSQVATATPGGATSFSWKGHQWAARQGVMAGQNSKAMTRLANVGVYTTGDLWITTMRHCLASGETLTESTPENSGVCKAPKPITAYSTGRIHTYIPTSILPSGYDFTFAFDAKVPKGQKGTRTALWTQNARAASGACDNLYAEIDVMESYGSRTVASDGTRAYDQTTWASCAGGVKTRVGSTIQDRVRPGYRYTYSASRTANQIAYQRNGATTGTHTCGTTSCPPSLAQPWQAIIQGEVFKAGSGMDYANLDYEVFPAITTIVYNFSVQASAPQVPAITVATGTNIYNGHPEPFRRLNLNIANQPLTTWSCVLDNAPHSCGNPFAIDIGPLVNSGHTFSITATNTAGSSTYNTSWYGGQSPPVATQTSNIVNGSRLSVFHANYAIQNQPLTSWACTLDGAPYSCPNPFSVDIGPVSYGGHIFRIYFANYAGVGESGADWVGGA